MGIGIALGVAVGVGLGVVFHNIVLGVGLGMVFGVFSYVGVGLAERIIGYPLTIWFVLTGAYIVITKGKRIY